MQREGGMSTLWGGKTPLLEGGIQRLSYTNHSSRGFGHSLHLELKGEQPLLTVTEYDRLFMRVNSGEYEQLSGELEKDSYAETFVVPLEKVQTLEHILTQHRV